MSKKRGAQDLEIEKLGNSELEFLSLRSDFKTGVKLGGLTRLEFHHSIPL